MSSSLSGRTELDHIGLLFLRTRRSPGFLLPMWKDRETRSVMERMEMDLLMIRLNACMSTGRHVEARRLLERVLELEPAHGIAHGMMGWVMWALVNDHERALLHFRLAVRWAPGDVNAWMHYLRLLAADGSEDELGQAYGRALAVPGIDRAQVHAVIAYFLERTGRRAQAAEHFRRAMRAATTEAEMREFRAAMVRARGGPLRNRVVNLFAMW